MRVLKTITRRTVGSALAAALVLGSVTPATAQPRVRVGQLPAGTLRPANEVLLSVGEGQLVNLPASVANVWTSNPSVADVYVSNARQINVFGKEFGEATIFATTASGAVVYSANVRVAQNITSVDRMLRVAMPEADLKVTTAGQLAVLTGTVASPEDAADAERLVTAALNPGVDLNAPGAQLKMAVMSRLRTATPLQVNLQVRIAEVQRDFVKEVGFNLLTGDTTGGFQFNIGQGNRFPGSITPGGNGGESAFDFFSPGAGITSVGAAGRLFGLDILGALDLAENDGVVATLARPNLTALSGETASFLAGGEIPIPIQQQDNVVTVEYKEYGVSLAFTPTVLADGRISMRVRPEVSELTQNGAVTFGSITIPALTTRRAETTVELGSGQSFVIGGLLNNTHNNAIDKAPFLGDLPILGALFRSKRFRRVETELLIVVTPYLVKPVSANRIALPTDGYRSPTDLDAFVTTGQTFDGRSGEQRPVPVTGAPQTVPNAPARRDGPPAQPGFSFK